MTTIKSKLLIGSIILLVAVIAWEAFGTRDIIDRDIEVTCIDSVLVHTKSIDTIFKREKVYIKGNTIVKDSLIPFEVLKLIHDTTIIHDTVRRVQFTLDTMDLTNAILRYSILSEGKVFAFIPELDVFPKIERRTVNNKYGLGGGMGAYYNGFNWVDVYDIELQYRYLRLNYTTGLDGFHAVKVGAIYKF